METRAQTGFDSSVALGVLIHTGSESSGNSSYEIDLDPQTTTFDSMLDVGQTFTDPALNLSITTLSADAAGATVSVSLDPLPCTHTSAIVSLSPSQSALAGGALTYNVSVTNTDGSACTASAFNVTAAVPSGWSGPIASPVLTIAPGASTSTTLQVTSPVTALAGSYPVSATAASSADSTKSATASSAYVVTAPLTAQVSTDQASYARNQTVRISATVLAGAAPAAGANVSVTVTRSNGNIVTASAVAGANGVATYNMRLRSKDPVGVYQVTATATMNGSSGSGATTFTVR